MKRKTMIALLAVTLCLSACANKNDVIEESTISTDAPAEADTEETETETETGTETETETAETADNTEKAATEEAADNSNGETTDEVETTDVLENAPTLEQELVNETKVDEDVDEIGRTECNEVVYTNTNSNIRVQPNASTDKVGTVKTGTQLTRTAVLDSGWSEISYNGEVCYISSKLVTTEKPVVQPAAETAPVAPVPVPAQTNNTTGQVAIGTTVVKDDITFVCCAMSPRGLNVYCLPKDFGGTWPDWLVNAYDSCGITNDMSDYDKCIAINNYICSVVRYADVGVSIEAAGCACITMGEATCTGYSQAFDYLCTLAGINSRVVGGQAAGAHAWNRVLINGTEYWVDVTWNDESNNAYLMSTSLWSDHEFGYIE